MVENFYFQDNPIRSGAFSGRHCVRRLSTSCSHPWYSVHRICSLCNSAFLSEVCQNISGFWQKLRDSLYILLSPPWIEEELEHVFYSCTEEELKKGLWTKRSCREKFLAASLREELWAEGETTYLWDKQVKIKNFFSFKESEFGNMSQLRQQIW